MTTEKGLIAPPVRQELGQLWGVDPEAVTSLIADTIVSDRDPVTTKHLAGACIIAKQHGLNPLTNEVYFFLSRDKKRVVPIVGIDGWATLANNKGMEGVTFEDILNDDGTPNACKCTIWKRGHERPVEVTEYFTEVKRNTQPWKSHPRRMLRHKSFIQCARIAFSIGGVYDEDEGRDVARGEISVEDGAFDPSKSRTATVREKASRLLVSPEDVDDSEPDGEPVVEPETTDTFAEEIGDLMSQAEGS